MIRQCWGIKKTIISSPKPDTSKPDSSWLILVTTWMLAMAFAAAGFIWYGIASWEDPAISILSMGLGIFLILLSVARIVRKEMENGNSKQGK